MMYKYYDRHERLLAESDSPIKFNLVLFPIFKDIEPKMSINNKKKVDVYKTHKEEEK